MPLTKNQKIALGCGGGGCLVLLVALIVVVAGYVVYRQNGPNNRNYNFNSNYNRNANGNSNNTNLSTDGSSSMSNDDRHRLYQAATATDDRDILKRVNRKLGFLNADDVPRKEYGDFLREHLGWIFKNAEWLKEVNTTEKARAYVERHIND